MRSDGGLGYFVQYGVMRAMLDHGFATFVPPNDLYLQQDHASSSPADDVVLVTSALRPLPRGARLLAQYAPNAAAQHAHLLRTQSAAVATLRTQPLQLTPFGEQKLRAATGTMRTGLEAVAHQTVTPLMLLDPSLLFLVNYSRVDSNPSRDLFVVGPDVVPALVAYVDARTAITSNDVRVVLLRSDGAR
jgi:hypothetical protein